MNNMIKYTWIILIGLVISCDKDEVSNELNNPTRENISGTYNIENAHFVVRHEFGGFTSTEVDVNDDGKANNDLMSENYKTCHLDDLIKIDINKVTFIKRNTPCEENETDEIFDYSLVVTTDDSNLKFMDLIQNNKSITTYSDIYIYEGSDGHKYLNFAEWDNDYEVYIYYTLKSTNKI